jgi:hypothetical protein
VKYTFHISGNLVNVSKRAAAAVQGVLKSLPSSDRVIGFLASKSSLAMRNSGKLIIREMTGPASVPVISSKVMDRAVPTGICFTALHASTNLFGSGNRHPRAIDCLPGVATSRGGHNFFVSPLWSGYKLGLLPLLPLSESST